MHGTAPLSNPQHFPELELTTPLPVKNLAPTILSHMTSTRWDTPSLASNCSATHTFLGPNDPELPSFGFESSFPSPLHAQLYPEGMVYLHGTDFGHYDPFPHTTHHQAPSFSRSVNLDLLVGNSTIVSNVPGFRVDQPPATPTRSPPASTPGLSQNGSTEHTGGVWKFLRMCSDNRYECLWDDGSGGLCRYSGTLVGVKRHLGRAHRLKRSVICPSCKKSLSSPSSLRLHRNKHTGDNPYKCPDCKMGFKSPNALQYHQKRHHGYVSKKGRQEVN